MLVTFSHNILKRLFFPSVASKVISPVDDALLTITWLVISFYLSSLLVAPRTQLLRAIVQGYRTKLLRPPPCSLTCSLYSIVTRDLGLTISQTAKSCGKITSNFPFSHSVFKSLILQTRKKPGFVWERLLIISWPAGGFESTTCGDSQHCVHESNALPTELYRLFDYNYSFSLYII